MLRRSIALVAALLLAACGSATTPTSPTGSAGPSPATTSVASAGPTGTLESPEPTEVLECPAAQPMSLDEYLGAYPACFGSADVQVAGWEGLPDGNGGLDGIQPAWLGGPPSDAALRGHLPASPCQPACEASLLGVHLDPARGLAFEDDSQWVILTGHRQDPAAAGCHFVPAEPLEDPAPSAPDPADVVAICHDAFVATAIQPAVPPADALAGCPTTAVITVDELQHAGSGCFHGRTIQVIGYADALPFIDFGGIVNVDPTWLSLPQQPYAALWSSKPMDSPEVGPACADADQNGPGTCSWTFVHYRPGSGVAFKPSHEWVIVTGHIADPLAATCVFAWPASWTDPKVSDSQARRMCRESFVITAIRPTAAP